MSTLWSTGFFATPNRSGVVQLTVPTLITWRKAWVGCERIFSLDDDTQILASCPPLCPLYLPPTNYLGLGDYKR